MLIVPCVSSAKDKNNSQSTSPRKYPIEKGVVYQKTTAMGIKSEPVIFFDKWGEWEAVETTTTIKMLGISNTTSTRVITKGDDVWDIDLKKKTGTHYKRPTKLNDLGVDFENVTKEVLGEMEIEELGEETFLGYKCKKYRFTSEKGMTADYLMYGNLMMKMKGDMMGIPMTSEVTRIEPGTPPADKFEVPKGVKITEVEFKDE